MFGFGSKDSSANEKKDAGAATATAPAATMPAGIMSGYIEAVKTLPDTGDVVAGTVSAIGRARVYIDIPQIGTGIILVKNT